MDIVWIDFNPTRGHEQAHVRPALILSPKEYNRKTSLVILCPITSHEKGYPFEVAVRGKKVDGVVLSDHIRSVDWRVRNVTFIEKTSREVFCTVGDKIRALLLDD